VPPKSLVGLQTCFRVKCTDGTQTWHAVSLRSPTQKTAKIGLKLCQPIQNHPKPGLQNRMSTWHATAAWDSELDMLCPLGIRIWMLCHLGPQTFNNVF
jgi:hypothetical protein